MNNWNGDEYFEYNGLEKALEEMSTKDKKRKILSLDLIIHETKGENWNIIRLGDIIPNPNTLDLEEEQGRAILKTKYILER
jgi:hypothetical protein